MDRKLLKFEFFLFLAGYGFGIATLSTYLLFRDSPITTEMTAILIGVSAIVGTAGYFLARESSDEVLR